MIIERLIYGFIKIFSYFYMVDIHKCQYNGHKGWVSGKTGRVRFGDTVYPNILVAIKYLQ